MRPVLITSRVHEHFLSKIEHKYRVTTLCGPDSTPRGTMWCFCCSNGPCSQALYELGLIHTLDFVNGKKKRKDVNGKNVKAKISVVCQIVCGQTLFESQDATEAVYET